MVYIWVFQKLSQEISLPSVPISKGFGGRAIETTRPYQSSLVFSLAHPLFFARLQLQRA